jgi:hypothetical protein
MYDLTWNWKMSILMEIKLKQVIQTTPNLPLKTNYENQALNEHHMCFFNKMLWLSIKKIPHVVYFSYQHWMNQDFPYRYGSVPLEKKI